MPPRKRESDEDKEAKFNKWKEEGEYKQLVEFQNAREANPEINGIALETEDISEDWNKVCVELFKLCETWKVPGRKAKGTCIVGE